MVIRNPSWSRGRFRNGKGRGPDHQQHRIWVDPAFGGTISGSCSLFYWIDPSISLPVGYNAIYNPANFYSLIFQRENPPYWNVGLQSQGNYISLPSTPGRHFIEARQDIVSQEFQVYADGNRLLSRAVPGLNPFSVSATQLGQQGFPWAAWLKFWPGAIPPAAEIYQQQIADSGPVSCQNIVVPSDPQVMRISANPLVFWEVAASGVQFSPSSGSGTYDVSVQLTSPIYGGSIPVSVSTTAGQPNSGTCAILSTGVCPTYLTLPRAVVVGGTLAYGSGEYAPSGNLTSATGQPQWNMPAAPGSGKYYTIGSLDCSDSGGYFGWSGDLFLYNNGVVAKSLALSVSAIPGYLALNYLPQGTWNLLGSTGVTGSITLT